MAVPVAEYVPFDPKTEAQLLLRQRLRDEIAALSVGPAQLLVASYHRPLPPRADVENVLLYNIGGSALNRALRNGVRFEVAPVAPAAPAYRYDVAPADRSFDHWREERVLSSFEDVGARSTELVDVWSALRARRACLPSGSYAGPFALRLRVRGPRTLGVDRIKGVIDGIVAALQHMPANARPPATSRYANRLALPEPDLLASLTDPAGAALGMNPLLLRQRWAPADDRLVAAEVVYRFGPTWTLAGTASAVRSL
jgi:hypothetical protein